MGGLMLIFGLKKSLNPHSAEIAVTMAKLSMILFMNKILKKLREQHFCVHCIMW